jgi:hypothetical protein
VWASSIARSRSRCSSWLARSLVRGSVELKGFGEVVTGADAEADGGLRGAAAAGQHDDRHSTGRWGGVVWTPSSICGHR